MSGASSKKPYDIYRDSYFRYLGYCNEVGEAFRPLWPRTAVTATYGVAVAYVLADTYDKGKKKSEIPDSTSMGVAITAGDVLLWQMLASVIVPGFTINRIAKGTSLVVKRFKVPNARYIPTIVGLAAIPLIIHPIDRMIDYFMDNTYRKYIA